MTLPDHLAALSREELAALEAEIAQARARMHADLDALVDRYDLHQLAQDLEAIAKRVGDVFPVEAHAFGVALGDWLTVRHQARVAAMRRAGLA